MNNVAPITGSTWIMLVIVGLAIAFFLAEAAADVGPSNDTALRHLTISEGTLTPAFDPAVTAYTATVDNAVTEIDVTGVPNHEQATLTIDGVIATSGEPETVALEEGANEIPVEVTAENLDTQTYTVTVTREAP